VLGRPGSSTFSRTMFILFLSNWFWSHPVLMHETFMACSVTSSAEDHEDDVPGICGWEFGWGCWLCTGLGSLKPFDLVQKQISDSQPRHMVNVAELPQEQFWRRILSNLVCVPTDFFRILKKITVFTRNQRANAKGEMMWQMWRNSTELGVAHILMPLKCPVQRP